VREVVSRCGSRIAAILIIPLVLCGCERVWYLTIEAVADGRPKFCFTTSSGCNGDGIQFHSILISEVDTNGMVLSHAWSLESKSVDSDDHLIKHLAYGVVPKGWVEDGPAASLRVGAYYSVNGQFVFVLSGGGRAKVYSLADFLDKRS
jgi:hypothetical protein